MAYLLWESMVRPFFNRGFDKLTLTTMAILPFVCSYTIAVSFFILIVLVNAIF